MATLDDARTAVTTAISKISFQRVDPATTPEQLAALDAALKVLQPVLDQIEIAQLDQSANAVTAAANGLRTVTNDARLDTLAQLKQQLGVLLQQLDDQPAGLSAATKLPSATDPGAAAQQPAPASAAPSTEAPAAVTAPGVEAPPAVTVRPEEASPAAAPINSTGFDDLRDEYQRLYDSCTITPGKEALVQGELNRLLAGRARYAGVAEDTPGMPWFLIGIIHGMEAGYRFDRHQYNGDPLTARTVNVPAGRPPIGQPPFSWEESARDALTFDGLATEVDFSIPHLLYLFEKFNGFGYRSRGVPTPYLWGCSTHYQAGKFIADHVFSATAVSDQVGAAVLVKELERRGLASQ